jgi:hypothetical protein
MVFSYLILYKSRILEFLCQGGLVASDCKECRADLTQKREGVIVFTHDARREIERWVVHAPASGANLEPSLLKQLLQFTNSPEMGVSPP